MFSTVVIGIDPSDTSQRAFRAGVELARALDAQIHLVTAFQDDRPGGGVISEQRQHAEHLLDRAASQVHPTGDGVGTHALPDKPADAILQVAGEVGADLIVIGNKGAQGARRVLGSVASAVTSGAPCSVTIVKTT